MKHTIKRIKGWALLTAAAALLMAGCASDPTVAEVNGEKILKSEFDTNFNTYKAQIESQAGPDVWKEEVDGRTRLEEAQEGILDMLIDTRLVAAKAKALGVEVTDADIETEISNAKGYFETEEKFNEFLETQKITLDTLKDMLRKELLFSAFYEKINEATVVSEQEIGEYYSANKDQFFEVTASHILLESEADAKAAKARLDAGEAFEALAKELSTDPSAQSNGGSLGTFGRGAMVPAFEEAVFAMEKGQISDPVQSEFGFHIIRCEGASQKTLEEAAEGIRAQLMAARQGEVYETTMAELRQSAKIEKHLDRLK